MIKAWQIKEIFTALLKFTRLNKVDDYPYVYDGIVVDFWKDNEIRFSATDAYILIDIVLRYENHGFPGKSFLLHVSEVEKAIEMLHDNDSVTIAIYGDKLIISPCLLDRYVTDNFPALDKIRSTVVDNSIDGRYDIGFIGRVCETLSKFATNGYVDVMSSGKESPLLMFSGNITAYIAPIARK